MKNIKIDLKNTNVTDKEIVKYAEEVKRIHEDLHKRAGNKKDFVGWLELPNNYDKKEFSRIKKAAKRIRKNSKEGYCIKICSWMLKKRRRQGKSSYKIKIICY